ncbi:hypothetical protein ncot_09985 [Nocardioides sp. JQ2195]|uniref:DUF6167 family protein n=1 Tax=Nocardioides sp. JQ2195 TaxID=2592334 RepID=UPI00143E1D29|nr:DUF6167 family protein [Nocardioides sp. JQ2195]QIX26898.1 hypothetical protein ncot_09985 [Nocardioides sp. JQ2195]
MSRTLWFAAGAGATVYAMNRARRLRETFTLDGLRDRASGIAAGARVFREEVAQGSADKENELRERLGLVPHGTPELESSGGKHRLEAAHQDPPRITTTNISGTNQEGTN